MVGAAARPRGLLVERISPAGLVETLDRDAAGRVVRHHVPGRGTTACTYDPAGRVVLTASDTMDGTLLRAPRGSNGFGYDPLFVPAGLDRTTAELPAEHKHRISNRGKALVRLRTLMDGLPAGG